MCDPIIPKDAISKAMKQLREIKGWSQGDVYRATGKQIERNYVSRLERGGVPDPRLSTLARLANAFGMTCGEFCDFVLVDHRDAMTEEGKGDDDE